MTNEEHNKYIGWAFLVNGLFQLLMLVFVLAILFAVLNPARGGGDIPPGLVAVILGFAGLINLIILSPNFVAAYAIRNKKPWARIAAIVAAALSAMNVPLGTLAAVYSFWFFCGDQWKSVYPETSGYDGSGGRPASLNEARWEGYASEEEAAYTHRTPPPPDWR